MSDERRGEERNGSGETVRALRRNASSVSTGGNQRKGKESRSTNWTSKASLLISKHENKLQQLDAKHKRRYDQAPSSQSRFRGRVREDEKTR